MKVLRSYFVKSDGHYLLYTEQTLMEGQNEKAESVRKNGTNFNRLE